MTLSHAASGSERLPTRRGALAPLAGWAGVALPTLATDTPFVSASTRARRRKRRSRRARERTCQAACNASCAACRQRCAVCNELQLCYHLPNSTQPLCKVALTPDNRELRSQNANRGPGAVCVTGHTFAGVTSKLPGCDYAFGVCVEEFP